MSYFQRTPDIVKVSLTNICNYRCVMCFNPGLRQERGRMDAALLHRIVDMCGEAGVGKISLGASGEPLLHPDFLSFLSYAKSRNLWVSTTTNASRLSPLLGAEILRLGINRVNLSIYSTTDEEHRQYTGTGLFDQVVVNIRSFLRLWKEQGQPCTVNMWFLQIPGVNSFEKHLAFWKPLADEVGLEFTRQPMFNWNGAVKQAGHTRLRLSYEQGRFALSWNRRRPCPDLQNLLLVLHTGEVLPCCQLPEPDRSGQLVFGRIPENSIMEVWSSKKYLAFKEAHARCRIMDYPTCVTCEQSRETRSIGISV